MKQVKKLQLLAILATIGCFNNGYTENETTLPVISHDTIVNKKPIDKIINNNNKIIDGNKYNKQLSFNKQLDNRINEYCELINSINKDIIKTYNDKAYWTKLFSKTDTDDLNKKIKCAAAKLSNLEYSIKEVKQYIDILKVLKNTIFFQKVVDFVQENSSKLLKGECIDFSHVFKQFGTEINKSLTKIYNWAENQKTLESKNIQQFLMYEALAMCPNLGITRVLKINNDEIEGICGLIDGIRTKDGCTYYGYSTGSTTYSIGLDLTNCF